ncbi:MGH1-like glycoside hydrolase domain-containing protein [Chitinophaga japonensis]|uniref:Glycosyl hydrolase family 63 n=1 Tax=Chitinophaga japonensis TaxID=104662 RepID=A0A562TCL6_CHIJA|nr:glucosidase [Chitinophaga japonensis]TWI91259.1 glycosyl hydrolase family 63 [Chitinophaga japonensis]
MNKEQARLQHPAWKKWGPYVSARQWGTVREDYSADGNAWEYTTHDMARSKAWRWGEDGIAGISDDQQLLCFAIALWNKQDPIIKERYFGLNGHEGNHGEDVKELYYYLDSTPTHSYMQMLYKYPQQAFPYNELVTENRRRGKQDPEFELLDTGIFNDDAYFDVFVEYAKADTDDLLVKLTIHNRGREAASLHVLPTLWFRNTWDWGYDSDMPVLTQTGDGIIQADHKILGHYELYCEQGPELLFTGNETNMPRLHQFDDGKRFYKDGINDYLVHGRQEAVNPGKEGTKAAANYEVTIAAGAACTIRLRLTKDGAAQPFADFDTVFAARREEADLFYAGLQQSLPADEKRIQRQAFAGMLWNKQFYYYYVSQWLQGDPAQPAPPPQRLRGRNSDWKHLNNEDIISMPDKWEYPWYAAWDLAFHCIPLAMVDSAFAKDQLSLLTREWYMHPNGELPAYEWALSDVNPPVHAWATYHVFQLDREQNGGKGDIAFLESVFHKLLLNFTWWVNRKDANGNNIFEGGFLGLDNIGVFDRNTRLPAGNHMEQADGTSWMAMYCLSMLRISLELARHNKVYADMATKFFEHFLYIACAINRTIGEEDTGLWDEEDGFFYDQLRLTCNGVMKMKVRSMVGLIPLFAVAVLDEEIFSAHPEFTARLKWFLDFRPDLASLVSRWYEKGSGEKHLLSLLRGHRMKRILHRMLDETEFLSDYGIRSLSKYYEAHPYEFRLNGNSFSVSYAPGESSTGLFGGNSNWRGPVWMPVNYLIIESLRHFHHYYGDDFKVEYPTRSGVYLTLEQIAAELGKRLLRLFLRDEQGRRPVFGQCEKLQQDPHFRDYILFYEYFHGDNGRGAGAAHQTGWTGLIVRLMGQQFF